jgi:RNA recognition motif-containing protein
MSDIDIRSIFLRFGRVNKAYAIRDEFGNSKGFGYVCFEQKDPASMVVSLKSIEVQGHYLIECLPYSKEANNAQQNGHDPTNNPHPTFQINNKVSMVFEKAPRDSVDPPQHCFNQEKISDKYTMDSIMRINHPHLLSSKQTLITKDVSKGNLTDSMTSILENSRLVCLNSRGNNVKISK